MNQDLYEKKARFQSEKVATRLGHIASNLARIRSFSNTAYKEAVQIVTDETLWFIEWIAAEIEPEQAEELVNIQVQLSRWKLTLDNIWLDDNKRTLIAQQADVFSQQVLDMSGLLSESIA
ncbi:MAG: hypothetical protein KME60_29915 [Cyanomargarita calcarea GSE-NOS-MK-12-04C]|jgi:hypothetical protein|uniref:Uncharacterized protein n=1 Tax=Cyanomargarita calcarea GSE-NOS-MK-12-04C TaxID=2839659 RepID=A0A951QSA3_9CYAN|nr:hypothetical protein [Cyanomargarita calcarea GSE-NOS-MK-12-04C]